MKTCAKVWGQKLVCFYQIVILPSIAISHRIRPWLFFIHYLIILLLFVHCC